MTFISSSKETVPAGPAIARDGRRSGRRRRTVSARLNQEACQLLPAANWDGIAAVMLQRTKTSLLFRHAFVCAFRAAQKNGNEVQGRAQCLLPNAAANRHDPPPPAAPESAGRLDSLAMAGIRRGALTRHAPAPSRIRQFARRQIVVVGDEPSHAASCRPARQADAAPPVSSPRRTSVATCACRTTWNCGTSRHSGRLAGHHPARRRRRTVPAPLRGSSSSARQRRWGDGAGHPSSLVQQRGRGAIRFSPISRRQ